MANNKEKRSYRKSGIQSKTPQHANNSKTKAKVIIKRTNTRTRTTGTEPMEHWPSKWVNDYVLETYNGTRYHIQDITNHHQ